MHFLSLLFFLFLSISLSSSRELQEDESLTIDLDNTDSFEISPDTVRFLTVKDYYSLAVCEWQVLNSGYDECYVTHITTTYIGKGEQKGFTFYCNEYAQIGFYMMNLKCFDDFNQPRYTKQAFYNVTYT